MVCLSSKGHSMVTYGQTGFEAATPMPHASGGTPFGINRHGPKHSSSGALCVEFSELTSSIPGKVTGRAVEVARPRSAEKMCVPSIFTWNMVIVFFSVLQAISSIAIAKAVSVPASLPLLSVRPSVPLSPFPPFSLPRSPPYLPISPPSLPACPLPLVSWYLPPYSRTWSTITGGHSQQGLWYT